MLQFYDTHVHVWTRDPQRYPWHPIIPEAHVPTYDFTGEQLIREMDLAGVARAVLVQSSAYGWDNGYMLDVLARHPERFRGIALADPADPDLDKRFADLASAPGVKGLRFHLLEDGHEIVFRVASDRVRAAAQDAGLVVTFQANPGRLTLVAEFAKAAPRLPIIVDHLGRIRWTGPGSSGLVELLALAEVPNVFVKLSGLEEPTGELYPFTASSPLPKAVVKRFGPARVMWGSNFPHASAAGSYSDLAGVVDACLPELSEGERDLIRWQTAAQLWNG